MASGFARIYLVGCLLGILAILIITLLLKSAGCSPHVRWICPYETYTLVRILGRGSSLLCLAAAGVSAVCAARQLFIKPRNAVRPLVKMAAVLVLAVVLPNVFSFLSENALGARPFAAAVRTEVASAPRLVL